MNIYLTAIIKSKAGQSESLRILLNELVKGSTQEAACLQYDLFQSEQDENTFIFHEIWKGEDGLALHNGQPHLKAFVENSADLLDGPLAIHRTKKLN